MWRPDRGARRAAPWLGLPLFLGIYAAALAGPAANAAQVTELQSRPLDGIPGKEGTMILVEYAPGDVDPIHRHDASAFLYVLEGTVVMQLKGGKPVTLTKGQTFFEGPNDIHIVGRNASRTKPARFIVVLVKNQGAPILTPVR
jgi:quercetin dioxygenase-like cupin family protein